MPEVVTPTLVEEDAEGGANDWGEVVTRQPYRKVRLDHLLTGRQQNVNINFVTLGRSVSQILIF